MNAMKVRVLEVTRNIADEGVITRTNAQLNALFTDWQHR